MEVSGQLHVPVALPRGEDPHPHSLPLKVRLGGLQSGSRRVGQEKKNSSSCQESNPCCPARSLVTVLCMETYSVLN
jgi:hypothetical protein